MSAEATIKHINTYKCSISRFGDGELDLVLNEYGLTFQTNTPELSHRLKEVLTNYNDEKLLLCLPWCLTCLRYRKRKSKKFWIDWAITNDRQRRIISIIRAAGGKKYVFGDTNITRQYIAMRNRSRGDKMFPMLKSLWENRDILIVEGEQTRLGVGNDLFENTRSISRILAPAKDAFSCYDKILEEICRVHQLNQLVILALGPTATILASDLSKVGIQALDVGHIDIEYEWYLQNATDKVCIPGKYTNEAKGGDMVQKCDNPEYAKQILQKICC